MDSDWMFHIIGHRFDSACRPCKRWCPELDRCGSIQYSTIGIHEIGFDHLFGWISGKKPKYISSFKKGFLPAVLLVFLAFGLIMFQPDLGTGVVLVLTCFVMIYIAGAKLMHFIGLGLIGVGGFVYLILSAPYRISRISAFLNPWEDPLGDGFQIIQ